jgi:elongator complex protein 1
VAFCNVSAESENVLPHLWQFTVEHRSAGKSLQHDLCQFEIELREAVGKIWARAEPDSEAVLEDTWSSRMAEKEKERLVEPVVRVVKPEVSEKDWRLDLFDMDE